MILIAIIFDNDFQVIVKYFRRILKTLLENILGDIINRNNEDYIARNLMSSLKEKYGVSSLGVLELADQLENFAKQYTTSGQMDEKESALLDLYSDYSVTKLCKSDDLVTTWKNYIESGFISETQPKS